MQVTTRNPALKPPGSQPGGFLIVEPPSNSAFDARDLGTVPTGRVQRQVQRAFIEWLWRRS
jgi:hypothetical protein